MTTPSVSVVIPTYNRLRTVGRAIDSVLGQTRPPEQIVVVDDGSEDGTSVALRQRYGDAIVLLTQPNRGVAAARNAGIAAATGELIAFLDSDDYWLPGKLESQLAVMADPSIVLSAANWRRGEHGAAAFDGVYPSGGVTVFDDPLLPLSRFEGHRLILSTWVARRQALLRVGCFDERMKVAEDSRLLFRLAFEGRFAVIPEVGMIFSDGDEATRLTRPKDHRYRWQLAALSLEFLTEASIRAHDRPFEVQRRIRRLLAYFMRTHAEHLLMTGRTQLGRRRALEALLLDPLDPRGLAAVVMGLFPAAARRRMKRIEA